MKKLLKNKRGVSFFLFDAVIAAFVFFIAIALITSSLSKEPDIETPKTYGENLMNYYLETQVADVKHSYIAELLANKTIKDPSRTIAEQIIIFSDKGLDETNENLTEYVSENKISESYGFNLTIINMTDNKKLIFQKNSANNVHESYINLKRVVITEDDLGNIIGPDILSLNVWY